MDRPDLNLLAIFDAVMQDRNLTKAAKRLGLSQPAVSHALARLRAAMGDELLVRGPDGMVPTARGEQLVGPIRDALAALDLAVQPQAARPEDMDRAFAIAVDGYTAFALANRIMGVLQRGAPRLRLSIVPSGTRDILDELNLGRLDLALTDLIDGGHRFKCSRVATDHYVAVLRQGHPDADTAVSIETLGRLRHLIISSTRDDTSFLDTCLVKRGLQRDVAISLPFLAAPEALAASDLVALMPARVAAGLARWGLVACAIACDAPEIALFMTWHRRLDGQAEHRWLRAAIRGCLLEERSAG